MADDELSEPMIVTKYHRKLDRTPEKNFDSHSEGLKILTCENRKALEKVSAKMTRLHDEIDDRDKVIEEEKKLRKEAEDKLHAYLVDPYSNPDINDELRERLPRANKTDPLRESIQSEQEIEDVMDREKTQNTSTARSQDVGMNSEDMHNSQSKTADVGGMPQTTTAAYRTPQTSISSFPLTTLANPLFGVPHLSNPPVYLPHSYTAPYLSSFLNSPLQQQSSNFLSPPRTFGMATSNDERLPSQGSPLNRSLTKTDEGSLSPADEQMSSPLRVDDLHQPAGERKDNTEKQNDREQPTTPHTTHPTFKLPSSTFSPSFRSPGFGSFPQHPPPGGTYFQDALHPQLSSRYQFTHIGTDGHSRQVALLLAELDTEKAKNKKLVDRVADLEIELEMNSLTLKTTEVDQHRNSETAQAAGLVQEVHAAQKKRDESVMGRIKVANQEREEALYRLMEIQRRLEDQGYQGSPDHSPDITDQDEYEDEADDENVENILTSLGQTDRAGHTEREWTTHIQKIEQIKHRQKEITAEEMQMLLDQRDAAVAKARRFEEMLLQQQRKDSHITEQNLRERLRVVQHERDLVVAKNKQLKEEIETIRIYYSLHKSLSQDSYLQDNTYSSGVGEGRVHKESNTTMAQLREMEHEKMQKEVDLQKLQDEHKQSQDKILRLEKLVEVLRRKLRTGQLGEMQDE